MRILSTLLAVFISVIACAQTYVRPNEEVILSFQTDNGRQAFVVKDKENKYISYRYGTKDSIELEYPGTEQDSWKRFGYSYYLRGGGKANDGMDLNYLHFSNRGYRYMIYQTYYAADQRSEVGIRITNAKTGRVTNIKGKRKTRKGTLIDFRDNGLLEVLDETI